MRGRPLVLGAALQAGWQAMWRYPGIVIGGYALYTVMSMAVGAIPIVGFIGSAVLLPPLVGGFMILVLNAVDDKSPTLNDLFAGFQSYGKWMGIYWLYNAIVLAAMVPFGIVGVLFVLVVSRGAAELPDAVLAVLIAVLSLTVVALLAVVIWVLVRWVFICYAGVESGGTLEAFNESVRLTKGRRLQVLWMFIVLSLIGGSGLLVLVVGAVITMPLSTCAMAALYRQLKPATRMLAPAEGLGGGPTAPGVPGGGTARFGA